MKDQLITYETGVLAKEKGFNIPVHEYHNKGRSGEKMETNPITVGAMNHNYPRYGTVSIPTQSLLQKWLREKHNIIVTVLPWRDIETEDTDPVTFRPIIFKKTTFLKENEIVEECPSYEEALEVGLYETLLII